MQTAQFIFSRPVTGGRLCDDCPWEIQSWGMQSGGRPGRGHGGLRHPASGTQAVSWGQSFEHLTCRNMEENIKMGKGTFFLIICRYLSTGVCSLFLISSWPL